MTHKYYSEHGGLLPLPALEKPKRPMEGIFLVDEYKYEQRVEAYNNWQSSIILVPLAYRHLFKDGEEYSEGVDFKVVDNIGGDKLIYAYGLITRVWGTSGGYGYGCAECCNGDRCDEDCTAKYKGSRKKDCPHSRGKSYIPFADAKEISVAIPITDRGISPEEKDLEPEASNSDEATLATLRSNEE